MTRYSEYAQDEEQRKPYEKIKHPRDDPEQSSLYEFERNAKEDFP